MNQHIIIHVGYPKAASTTLQMQLFAQHPNINYLGPTFDAKSRQEWENIVSKNNLYVLQGYNIRRFWENFRDFDEIKYKANLEQQYFIYKEVICPLLNSKKINVFSHEEMLNSQYGDNGLKAHRIKQFFPNTKIIIILRNQIEAIRSLYEMHPAAPLGIGTQSKILSIDKWIERNFQSFHRSFLSGLYYSETLDFYKDLFGENNIGIFLFEELKTQPNIFAEKLSKFLNIDLEETKNLLQNSPKNTANDHVIHNLRLKLLPGVEFSKIFPETIHRYSIKKLSQFVPKGKPKISQYKLEELKALYKCSNRKLVSELGIDISKYNYPL